MAEKDGLPVRGVDSEASPGGLAVDVVRLEHGGVQRLAGAIGQGRHRAVEVQVPGGIGLEVDGGAIVQLDAAKPDFAGRHRRQADRAAEFRDERVPVVLSFQC